MHKKHLPMTSAFWQSPMVEVERRSECPISCSLDIWGDKWSLLIIRDLMLSGQCTYGDFLKSPEGIATNILAARLKLLEMSGLIEKSEHPGSKAKVLYRLTPKGIDLLPVMVEVNLWAERHLSISDHHKALLKIVKKDKSKFIKNRMRQLRSLIPAH